MKIPICYLDGKFVPLKKASLPITDLGIIRGFAVFDFFRTYDGKSFHLADHLKRLKNSAKLVGLNFPWTIAKLQKIVLATLAKNRLIEANTKIIITGGPSKNGITPNGKPRLVILVTQITPNSPAKYLRGVKTVTIPATRIMPMAKTTNYTTAVAAVQRAYQEGAEEALYTNHRGEILEGTRTNFFVFKNNTLITPKDGILLGITRKIVINLARKRFSILEKQIKKNDLKTVDEAFITSSSKEIMPVVQVDGLIIGAGKVGDRTKRLMADFKKLTFSP